MILELGFAIYIKDDALNIYNLPACSSNLFN